MTKVIVLGLDGFSPIFLEKWLSELPNFKELIRNGVYGELKSTIPPTTLPAWASMFTGKTPGKLENFGLVHLKEDYSKIPVNPLKWKGQYVWDLLSMEDKKVGIFALPFLSIAYSVNGFMISDLVISENMYPPDFIDLDDVVNKIKSSSNEKETRWKYFYEKPKLFRKLLEKTEYSYDFYFFLISISDVLMHLGTISELKKAYIEIDRLIIPLFSRICEEYDYNLTIVSDHGSKQTLYKFNINTYLYKKGYLKIRTNAIRTLSSLVAQKLMSILPISIIRRLKKMYEKNTIKVMKLPEIDYRSTKAFASGPGNTSYCGIWLNKKGVFKNGTVSSSEEQKLLKQIIKDLKQLDIIEEIYTREELGYPSNSPEFPDLIIKVADEFATYFPIFSTTIHKSEELIHSENGIFIAKGKTIKKGKKLAPVNIYDIAPTILHIFGLPIPNDMDGRVLMEIFEEDSEFAKRKPKYVDPSYYGIKQEDEKLKKAIRNLKLKGKI